jgi:uncharacterized protein YndB with AHSA1/START domain
MSDLPTYMLERTFDAPRELVWKAWTDPKLVSRWYGPNAETIVHRLDLKPGGLCLVEMRWGRKSNWQRVEYVEVKPPELLIWLHSSADANWNVIPSPMMTDWPRTLLTTVTFEQAGDQTKLRLTWVPHEACAAEIAFFRAAISGMDKGWAAGMELLKKLLVDLQA